MNQRDTGLLIIGNRGVRRIEKPFVPTARMSPQLRGHPCVEDMDAIVILHIGRKVA